MAVYEPRRVPLSTGLDDTGATLSMQRLPGETLIDFRKRLYLEIRDPGGPTEADLYRIIGRHLGLLQYPVFQIDLIMDGDTSLAVDPYIEITSTRIRLYDDYENNSLEMEIDLYLDEDGKFLIDLKTRIDTSLFFTLTTLVDDYDYLLGSLLKMDSSIRFIPGESLLTNRVNKLRHGNIREFWATQVDLFTEEKNIYDDLTELGDYYIGYFDGVVWTRDPGKGFVSYTYRDFPFYFVYSEVRAEAVNDSDLAYLLYDPVISDVTGEDEFTKLSPKGGWLYNQIAAKHMMGWGE